MQSRPTLRRIMKEHVGSGQQSSRGWLYEWCGANNIRACIEQQRDVGQGQKRQFEQIEVKNIVAG
ncbi:hypothetical protein AG1IA_06180 [Rhizoctonia solani AG-1 IA]|uniref:Uncharacterized protein n=1 Tax=Thanatephorus cucumeris (strain AG1-IA) TaxID=983506 RepID=L8WSM1_THACA|nr:hypothetical protein AG1IA_06180 [Rhizoctonia solani AG-1 IA]